MSISFRLFLSLFVVVALPLSSQSQKYLANLKQLTNGGQNAESYWAPDGQRLIFQSTRDGRQCDQIYTMKADGSDVQMVSTGKGVTTCGYYLPDGKHIVYGSTHERAAECPPRPDRSRGYVWAVYPGYDIYLAKADGSDAKKITEAEGYDAEATINNQTKSIVYTSKSSGDLDLWRMNVDGSGKKQLTKSYGYDGGAFFSRDGKKMVWRANHPQDDEQKAKYKELLDQDLTAPMKMELFIANADGSGAKQITNFGCASFAPTFTPGGKHLIFASNKNKCDSRNFELFLMDLDGGNLQQVTDFGGFTSFAEFSPDGKKVAFTSSYQGKGPYEFNIFVADWKGPTE